MSITEKTQNQDGVLWAVFISMVVVFGFLTVVTLSNSSVTDGSIERLMNTAGTGNIEVKDVDITIIPLEPV